SVCGHCGLPAAAGEAYCCYGCELAAQISAEGNATQAPLRTRLVVSLCLSMSVMMLSLFLFAEDVYGTEGPAGGAGSAGPRLDARLLPRRGGGPVGAGPGAARRPARAARRAGASARSPVDGAARWRGRRRGLGDVDLRARDRRPGGLLRQRDRGALARHARP